MKSYIKILALTLTLIVIAVAFPKQVKAQQENVSLQIFYDELSPYGQWVDYSNYGYVWIPDVGNDFEPYSTDGHWVMTDYGWTWMSDYEWGWAPFHYGRWNYDDFYGWFWVPDTEWGPAWVTWRSADGYYGWSPMESGLSISLSFGRPYNSQNNHWTFVRDRDIDRTDVSLYYANQNDRNRIIRNSTVINQTYIDKSRNATYVSGPSREDVQRVTGRNLKAVSVQETAKPGEAIINGQLRIFRPQINKNNNQGIRPSPSRVMDINDVQRPSERRQVDQPRSINQNDNYRQGRQQDNVNQRFNNQRSVVPQNINQSVPARQQQRVVNPQENYQRPVVPQNENNSIQGRGQQPQRIVSPQESNPRPVAPQHTITSPQDRRQQPQRYTRIQENNSGQGMPQNVNQNSNDRRPQPQGTLTPQNNNTKVVPVQNAGPAGRNKRQQKAVNSSNTNTQQPDQTKPDAEKKKPE